MNTTVQTPVDSTVAETQERIRKETSKAGLVVTKVYKSAWQKEGTLSAEIKQTVKTLSFYPSKSVSNDMQDNIFGIKDFGFKENEPYENVETRVAWIDVPVDSTTESVTEKLKSFPNATLYRVLSNKPILNDSQKYAITAGLTTMDVIGNRQAVRYPDNHPDAGSLVLDENGKCQYRQVCFKVSSIQDMDTRTAEPLDVYLTAEIKNELEEAGQKVL